MQIRIDNLLCLGFLPLVFRDPPLRQEHASVGGAGGSGDTAPDVGPTADRAQSSACRLDAFLLATASGRPRAGQARAHGCRRQGVSPDDHATRFRDVAVEDNSEIHLVKIGRLYLSRSEGLAE